MSISSNHTAAVPARVPFHQRLRRLSQMVRKYVAMPMVTSGGTVVFVTILSGILTHVAGSPPEHLTAMLPLPLWAQIAFALQAIIILSLFATTVTTAVFGKEGEKSAEVALQWLALMLFHIVFLVLFLWLVPKITVP